MCIVHLPTAPLVEVPSWFPPAAACSLGFFFSSRRRHTRLQGDWCSDVCSSDLRAVVATRLLYAHRPGRPCNRYPHEDWAGYLWTATTSRGQARMAQPECPYRAEQAQIGRASCRERVENAARDDCLKHTPELIEQ